MVHSKI